MSSSHVKINDKEFKCGFCGQIVTFESGHGHFIVKEKYGSH
jgi:hypothetical protein